MANDLRTGFSVEGPLSSVDWPAQWSDLIAGLVEDRCSTLGVRPSLVHCTPLSSSTAGTRTHVMVVFGTAAERATFHAEVDDTKRRAEDLIAEAVRLRRLKSYRDYQESLSRLRQANAALGKALATAERAGNAATGVGETLKAISTATSVLLRFLDTIP